MPDPSPPDARTAGPGVLVVGLDDKPGGLNRYAEDLVAALHDAGARATLLTVGARTASVSPQRILIPPTRILLLRLWRLWRAAQRLADQVDVLDVHFALHGLLLVYLGALRRKPLVVHFHGPWAAESSVQGASRPAAAAKFVVERLVYRKATKIVVLSDAFKRVLVKDYRIAPWCVEIVRPGVDLDRFRPGDRRLAREYLGIGAGTVVVAVRRLVPRMGLDVLLAAWSQLVSAADGGVDMRLLIAGDGPLFGALNEQAERSGLASSVQFLGPVEPATVLALYQAADLTVVPSLALEGFGLVVLESLATGTPVVATRVGGLPEALGPLDPSLLVPPGDAAALGKAIVHHLSEPKRLSPDACRRYAEGFNWGVVAADHLRLYGDVEDPSDDQQPLRVVYLDHTAKCSGGELAMARLIPALRPDVAAHVILAEAGPLVDRLEASGVSVEVLPMAGVARELRRDRMRPGAIPLGAVWSTIRYSIHLARRLRDLRPDLVHTNSLKAMAYGTIAAKIARRPVVVHIRDRIAADYLPRPAVRAVRLLCRRLAGGVVANSPATLATLPGSTRHVAVIPSPVSLGKPSAAHTRPDDRPFTAALVGRIAPWKGQDLFLRAFAAAFRDGPERGLVVGSPLFGEDAYDTELRLLVRDLGIADRIEFTGFCDDVGELLRDIDVLVHTSILPEPFGLVVAEGMAAGLCVIASNEGGPATFVTDGLDGILCEPRSVDEYARALRRVRSDPDLRARLGTHARKTASQFAPEVVAEQMLRSYRLVAGSHRDRR